MSDCIFVREIDGYYEIPGSSEILDWLDISGGADSVERIELLTGWGQWAEAYRVDGSVFFVSR